MAKLNCLPLGLVLVATAQADVERLEINGQRRSGYLVAEQQGASWLALTIQQTPQTVTVISAEKLQDFALNDLQSALEYSATVNVEQVETERTALSSRGFELTNRQIDGLGLNHDYGTTTGRIDTALFERIELVHGANGVMTGVGSPAATVNMVRKKPTSTAQTNMTTQVGSWQSQRIEADISRVLTDSLRARTVMVMEQRQSYLDRYANRSKLGYVVMDYAPNSSNLVTIGHSIQRSDSDSPLWGALTLYYGDGTPTQLPRNTNMATDWSYWDTLNRSSFIVIDSQFNPQWSARIAYQHSTTDEQSQLFYTYVADADRGLDPITGLGLVGYASDYDYNDQHDALDIVVKGRYQAFAKQHQVAFGVSYARLDYRDRSLYDFSTGLGFPSLPAVTAWQGDSPRPNLIEGLAGSDIDTDQRAVFGQSRLQLTDKGYLLIGGRLNHFTATGNGYGVVHQRDEQRFIPYFGATYKLTENSTVYGSYTETFKAQNLRDRSLQLLPALTGESAEVGIKSALFDDNALLSVAYFQITQRHLGVSDGTVINPLTEAPEPVYRAVDGITSRGIEVELSGQLSAALHGSIAATSFTIRGDEMVANYTPKNLFRGTLSYQFSQLPELKVGINLLWQDRISRFQGVVGSPYSNAGEAIISQQGGYSRVNVMASYQLNQQLSISLNANNLFDTTYLNSLLWSQAYYGAPRNLSASLRLQF